MNSHTLNEIKSIAISYASEGYENTLVAGLAPHLVEGEVMVVTGRVWHSPVDPVEVIREFSLDYLLEELRLLKNESTLQPMGYDPMVDGPEPEHEGPEEDDSYDPMDGERY